MRGLRGQGLKVEIVILLCPSRNPHRNIGEDYLMNYLGAAQES